MLIGLNGAKQVGKDTIGNYLVKNHDFTRIAFADKVKETLATLFDVPVEWIDAYKNDENCMVSIGWENEPSPSVTQVEGQPSKMWSPMTSVTLRHALQRVGTEIGRNMFGEDFWIDQVLPYPHSKSKEQGWAHTSDRVVTDVRFENEALRIKDLGGYIARIMRPGKQPMLKHANEDSLPDYFVDYEINNNSSKESLYDQVRAFLNIAAKESLDADPV